MLTELQKAARNGCKIVSVNPLPETGTDPLQAPAGAAATCSARAPPLAYLFLPVRINGDVALLKGIMKEMLEEDERSGGNVLAHDFIEQHTEGFDAFAADLRRGELGRDRRAERHLARADPRGGARSRSSSERMICCWAMGITQHKNGVANVQAIVNFALLRGQIGQRGRRAVPGARPQQRAGRPHRRASGRR